MIKWRISGIIDRHPRFFSAELKEGGVGISNSNIPELINSLSKYRSNDGGDSGKETLAASIARLI